MLGDPLGISGIFAYLREIQNNAIGFNKEQDKDRDLGV